MAEPPEEALYKTCQLHAFQKSGQNSFLIIQTFLFVSDTGTTPPESGIFGFMINFSAFLGKYPILMKNSVSGEVKCVIYSSYKCFVYF